MIDIVQKGVKGILTGGSNPVPDIVHSNSTNNSNDKDMLSSALGALGTPPIFSYPLAQKAGKKLPLGKNFGVLKADWCEAYYPNYNNIFSEQPKMFVDLELSNEKVRHVPRHLQIHLGFSGNIRVKHPSKISSKIKPHFDVYLPYGTIEELIGILLRMKEEVDKSMERQEI